MNKIFYCVFVLLVANGLMAQNFTMVVGTYTKGKSAGIYLYNFKPITGEATILDSAKAVNPSFLTVSPNNKFIYAVKEVGSNIHGGRVSAYSFDGRSKNLSFINDETSAGDDPCYITTSKNGKWVITGNYSSGSLSVLPVKADGSMGSPVFTNKHEGSGPNKGRQGSPHVHATVLSPDNKYLFVPDLGIDKVVRYDFNLKTGILSNKKDIVVTAGSGPRHIDFHPSGKWVYLVQELSGTVTVFKYNNGDLHTLQEISLLSPHYEGAASSADVHVSPDGRFVYASNRAPSNTITIFKIDQRSGKLAVIGHQSTRGNVPRNFSFDPTGSVLLVANQESDNIVIFKVNKNTGLLTATGKEIIVPNPVCIKWIGVKKK